MTTTAPNISEKTLVEAFAGEGLGATPCSAWIEASTLCDFLACRWGSEDDDESSWFPIDDKNRDLPPSKWADHPADFAPESAKQTLWDLCDKAWGIYKQNA